MTRSSSVSAPSPASGPSKAAAMHRGDAGFSLIEMMVVLAVVAILALMAVPSSIDKVVREQVAQALPLADVAKPAVAMAWSAAEPMPADNAAAGLPAADKIVSKWVSATALQNGAIHLTFGNRAHAAIRGKVLSLRPAVVTGEKVVPVSWVCGLAAVPGGMTVQGNNLTDLPAKHLPLNCR